MQASGDEAQALAFLRQLVGLLEHGLVLGGQGARGLGRVRLHAPARHRAFDLTDLDGLTAWLDESWLTRGATPVTLADDATFDGTAPEALLRVRFGLAVPRGQDVCLGDGQALDHDIEPQQVTCADGQSRWRLPGSALRGVMRAWVARLAAREGRALADSVQRFQERAGPATGAEIGWGGDDDETRKAKQDKLARDPAKFEHEITCPVLRLFGSLYAAGRIHVSDALSEEPVADAAGQSRCHVAVDRITGGASEGFLFDHQALTRARFQVDLSVRAPQADEARWLASTLRAIDFGLIRLGSSKSAGRLALSGAVVAEGPESAAFSSLTRSEVRS
jgi:CRISPR/Cas system CSM-associated protein Csm3 (group 7 of RAMP superfamily)